MRERASPRQSAIECDDCGLLQRRVPLEPRQAAHCRKCGAFLYHEKPGGTERALALTVAGKDPNSHHWFHKLFH